jgi:hypothetical protein
LVEHRSPKPRAVGSSPSTPARPSSLLAAASPRQSLALGLLLAVLAMLPFFVSHYPQQGDYASHLARYHVMMEHARNADLARHYLFEWQLGGNLGMDLLVAALAPLLGLERAAWALSALIPMLTGLGLVAVEWTLRRRIGIGAVLAFATIWSPALAMGFANFCLALALALLGFALWVRLEGRRWRWAVMLPWGLATWLCHLAGWGVLGVLVAGYQWHRAKSLRSLLEVWPLAPPFLLLALGSGGGTALAEYGQPLLSYKLGIWIKALRDRVFMLDFLTPLLLIVAMLMAARRGRFDMRLGWAALALAALTLLMPRHLAGGDYADYRLVAVALMVGALAIDWAPPRWLLVGAAALFLARLAATTLAWQAESRALDARLAVLDQLPKGARVAGVVAVDEARWALDPFEHAPSYAALKRDALVNSHFARDGFHLLRLRSASLDFTDPSQRLLIAPGAAPNLAAFAPTREADYLWYLGTAEPSALPAGSTVVARAPGSLLLRLASGSKPH